MILPNAPNQLLLGIRRGGLVEFQANLQLTLSDAELAAKVQAATEAAREEVDQILAVAADDSKAEGEQLSRTVEGLQASYDQAERHRNILEQQINEAADALDDEIAAGGDAAELVGAKQKLEAGKATAEKLMAELKGKLSEFKLKLAKHELIAKRERAYEIHQASAAAAKAWEEELHQYITDHAEELARLQESERYAGQRHMQFSRQANEQTGDPWNA